MDDDGKQSEIYKNLALPLHKKGFSPLPIPPRTKKPITPEWPTITIDEAWVKSQIARYPNHGIGIRSGDGILGFDVDVYDFPTAKAIALYMDELLGDGGPLVRRFGQFPKFLTPLYCSDINEKITKRYIDTVTGEIHGIEVLTAGQQFVAFGIHEKTGKPYEWTTSMLSGTPTCTGDQVRKIIAKFDKLAVRQGWVEQGTIERETERISKTVTNADGTRPGDLFNASQSMTAILSGYGWTITGERGSLADGTATVKVIRPGKTRGISGSVVGDSYLLLFSTSVPELPVPSGRDWESYDIFGVFSNYEHGGNKSAAGKALAEAMREVTA